MCVILVIQWKHNQHHTTQPSCFLSLSFTHSVSLFVALFLCSWLPDSYSLQFPISLSQLRYSVKPINESHVLDSLFHQQLVILLITPFLALEEVHYHHLMLSKRNSSNPRVQTQPMIPKPLLLRPLSSFSLSVAPVALVSYSCSFSLLLYICMIYVSVSVLWTMFFFEFEGVPVTL